MTYTSIELTLDNGVAKLTLNRPDKLNSFTSQMHQEVRDAFSVINDDPSIRCLLLTGNGKGFCAGQDLGDRAVSSDDKAPNLSESVEKNYNPLIRALSTIEMPVICAVNGVAAGAGANIALACDIVIAAKSACFIESFNKLGLIPDSGGSYILPRLVGQARAMGICLLGEKITADQALAWGMIWQVVEDDDLQSTAEQMAIKLAQGPTKGLAMIKKAIRDSSTNTLDQQLDKERDMMGIAGSTEDYQEGVKAFLEKRAPVYKGQ